MSNFLYLYNTQIKEVHYPKVQRPGRLDSLAILRLIRHLINDARRRLLPLANRAKVKRLPLLRLRNSFIVRSLLRVSLLAILLACPFRLLRVAPADFLAATKGGHDHLSGAHNSVSGAPVLLLVDFLLQVLVVVTVQPLLRPNHLLPSRLEFVHVPSRRITKSRRPRPTNGAEQQQQQQPQEQLQSIQRQVVRWAQLPTTVATPRYCPSGAITCHQKSWPLGAHSTKHLVADGLNISTAFLPSL